MGAVIARIERVGLAGILLAIAVVAGLGFAGWRVNFTPSVPGTIFREVSSPIAVGRYVSFCLPWSTAQLPMSKKTVVPVCTADHPDRVPLIKIVRKIEPDGALYVRGTDPRSYDSRYYGPIPQSAVKSVLIRVW